MTCPNNPPPPAGYRVWRGAVPTPLTQWAMDLRDHIAPFPYGQTWTLDYQGTAVVARKDFHSWTFKNGVLVSGICIPGITLYSPIPAGVAATLGDDLATPDPNLAVYGATPPETTNWGLVLLTGALAGGVVWGFFEMLRRAGAR